MQGIHRHAMCESDNNVMRKFPLKFSVILAIYNISMQVNFNYILDHIINVSVK